MLANKLISKHHRIVILLEYLLQAYTTFPSVPLPLQRIE
jgi:hypothetical protein